MWKGKGSALSRAFQVADHLHLKKKWRGGKNRAELIKILVSLTVMFKSRCDYPSLYEHTVTFGFLLCSFNYNYSDRFSELQNVELVPIYKLHLK